MDINTVGYSNTYEYRPKDTPKPYRGFTILRNRPYYLYEIEPRDGYDLPAMLSGKFTKLETLYEQVDHFFLQNSKATAELVFVERTEQRRRGRPRKARALAVSSPEKGGLHDHP